MADLGRYAVTRRAEHWGAFKTPGLRNVALTAPYMHDGSEASLEDVVRFYARGGTPNPNLDVTIHPRELSDEDIMDLVAFLHSLTSERLADSTLAASFPERIYR
jgi:cytochrome c peroxidase